MPPSDQTSVESPEERNTRRFLEQLERCVNGREYEAMTEFYAEGYRSAGCAGQASATGPAEELAQLEAVVDAFPDFRYEVESIIADGDSLVVVARFTGTHLGEFLDLAPTGRRADVPFVDMLRFEDGMMIEYWGVFDTRALKAQLSVTSA